MRGARPLAGATVDLVWRGAHKDARAGGQARPVPDLVSTACKAAGQGVERACVAVPLARNSPRGAVPGDDPRGPSTLARPRRCSREMSPPSARVRAHTHATRNHIGIHGVLVAEPGPAPVEVSEAGVTFPAPPVPGEATVRRRVGDPIVLEHVAARDSEALAKHAE